MNSARHQLARGDHTVRALTTAAFRRAFTTVGPGRAHTLEEVLIEPLDHGAVVEPTTGKPVFTYAHPIVRAPFSLIGDGGSASASSPAR